MEIPEEIIQSLLNIHTYAGHIDNWIILKRQLLISLPSPLRSLFSKRHPLSKRTKTNALELELARRWTELTGRPIIFKDDEGKTEPDSIT